MIEQVTVVANPAYPLEGLLTLPDDSNENIPAAVFVHGSGPLDKDETIGANKLFRDLAEGLASKGIGSLRYDKRTHTYGKEVIAELGGKLTVKEEIIEDAIKAIHLLKKDPRVDANRVFLIGHSQGGMLAPRIDAEGGDLAGLVLLAGTARTLEEVILNQNEDSIKQLEEAQQEIALKQVKELQDKFDAIDKMTEEMAQQTPLFASVYGWYLKEMKQHPVRDYFAQSKKTTFVIQGDQDVQVSVEKDFDRFREMLRDNKNASFKLYPGLNHLFMKSIYGTLKDIWQEYNIPQTVDSAVVEDIAHWILSVKTATTL
ncbi:alpha/beta hydrolase family protein [Paenibacillus sacheonensis]|uniref:Alpha/beta fold hydrolase n=1 Tax=Paenibacillus sacheonensis TaxID=742054 RepID=A0A7X5C3W0_9BACL|nr:alpha/beta fold hydrolase [Paenibacillus sacheonensis]MBM7569102.1 dienelactone hydrolase [Paenibacillus sacheonensis]NBC72720.1 alpha/beta fold hydrolase [Paenibacillus sacheonensis]